MDSVKGARALASGMLVLAAICAAPAISAAQDTGTPAVITTTATTPADPTGSAPPDAPPADSSAGEGSSSNDGSAVRNSSGSSSVGVPAPESAAAASATSPPKAHKAASASVNMGDFFFSPASVTIAVGDTVTWHNSGQAPHNATGDGISTGTIDPGGSGSHPFNAAGTFSYICAIRPQMKGTVRVLSSS